jgi:hypothetical protein
VFRASLQPQQVLSSLPHAPRQLPAPPARVRASLRRPPPVFAAFAWVFLLARRAARPARGSESVSGPPRDESVRVKNPQQSLPPAPQRLRRRRRRARRRAARRRCRRWPRRRRAHRVRSREGNNDAVEQRARPATPAPRLPRLSASALCAA